MRLPPRNLSFRIATPRDLPALHTLALESFVNTAFSRDLLMEKLFDAPWPDHAVQCTHVAETGNAILGMMQSVVRPAIRKAWVGLFAVAPASRRLGIATALLARVRREWPEVIDEVQVLSIPGNYFAPGLDTRHDDAVAFLHRAGFKHFKDCVNLRVDLATAFDASAAVRRLADDGITIRRANQDDSRLLDLFFAEHFGSDWRCEANMALRREPPALHLALQGDRTIGFAAHSTQNLEWGFFGPMGTAPQARGRGIGRVLLWQCLNDLREAGHRTAVVPWVGPVGFYQQWASARIEQTFRRYRLLLKPGA